MHANRSSYGIKEATQRQISKCQVLIIRIGGRDEDVTRKKAVSKEYERRPTTHWHNVRLIIPYLREDG